MFAETAFDMGKHAFLVAGAEGIGTLEMTRTSTTPARMPHYLRNVRVTYAEDAPPSCQERHSATVAAAGTRAGAPMAASRRQRPHASAAVANEETSSRKPRADSTAPPTQSATSSAPPARRPRKRAHTMATQSDAERLRELEREAEIERRVEARLLREISDAVARDEQRVGHQRVYEPLRAALRRNAEERTRYRPAVPVPASERRASWRRTSMCVVIENCAKCATYLPLLVAFLLTVAAAVAARRLESAHMYPALSGLTRTSAVSNARALPDRSTVYPAPTPSSHPIWPIAMVAKVHHLKHTSEATRRNLSCRRRLPVLPSGIEIPQTHRNS